MKKMLRQYVPGAGIVIDAVTGNVIQSVASRYLPTFMAAFMFVFAFAVALAPVLRTAVGVFAICFGVVAGLEVSSLMAQAQTDITSTVSTLSGLWDTIETLAIGIVLFVLGRKLLKKV